MRAFAIALAFLASCAPFETVEEAAEGLYRTALARAAEPERARALLDEAIGLDPGRAEFYLARAEAGRRLRLAIEVEADFTSAIGLLKRDPGERSDLAAAHLGRGIARADGSRLTEAEADATEALRIAPGLLEGYLHRAQWRRRAGRAREAEEDLARARELGAGVADLFYNAGVRELRNLRTDEAERQFVFAADLEPAHVRAWMGIARCGMERGRYAAAVEALTRAIELQPQAGELYYNRANAYRAQERWEEAFADAIQALDRDPGNPMHYVVRGVIYRQYHKDTTNAQRDFDQALELDPLSPVALLERGILYHEMRLLNDAERDIRQALSRRASPEAVLALGRVLRDKGEYDKAVEAYRRALEIYPDPEVQKALKDELERALQAKESDR